MTNKKLLNTQVQVANNKLPRFTNFKVDSILDETVREGSQRSLFKVPTERYLKLLHAMTAAGLRLFVISSGPDEIDLVRRCLDEKLEQGRFPNDVEFYCIWLMNCWDVSYKNFSQLPKSYVKDIAVSFGMIGYKKEDSLFERVIEQARGIGIERFQVSVLNDFKSGFDEEGYEHVAREVERVGAVGISSVRINDSTGKLFPDEVAVLSARLVNDFPEVTFCLHAHNDRGLALANALTALYHGFAMAEGALAGLGNRAGLPAHEELVKACQDRNITLGRPTIDLARLILAVRLAEETFMITPSLYRPISGIHAEWDNASIVNIPDFLRADGARTYYLNAEGLHPDTISKILLSVGFDEKLANDSHFVERVLEAVRLHMLTAQNDAYDEFRTLNTHLSDFYSRLRFAPEMVKDIASSCAVDYLTNLP